MYILYIYMYILYICLYIYTDPYIYDPPPGRLCPFRGGTALAATRCLQRHSMGGAKNSSAAENVEPR